MVNALRMAVGNGGHGAAVAMRGNSHRHASDGKFRHAHFSMNDVSLD